MPLPADFIERLKTANPLTEVMGTYVTLKRTGSDFVCLCPFHNEKTPSCHVHPGQEYFHCFGCGAGGDVITFVMKYNNLDYWEAVKQLADRGGLTLPEDNFDRTRTDMRKKLYEINSTAARFFYDRLRSPEGRGCLEYLIKKRRLTPETIKKYGMGFAPNSWGALKTYMLGKGYTEQELETASLLGRSGKTGRTYDFFMNRAMFPFIDLAGHIVGFGGRALSPDDNRKYLNSRDTPCYSKNRFLFSMNFAKNAAVKERKIILCEGNLDVISLNQYGFENAVASCGTALTPEQAKLISNYANQAIICYDSDEAGQKATQRAIGILDQTGLKTTVIKMTGAKDPDEYLNKFGADHFKSLISGSVGAVEFELEKCREGLDMDSDLGRVDYLKRAYRVIAAISSPGEREIYISKIAREQNIDKDAIRLEINSLTRRARASAERRDWQRTASFTNLPRDEVNPEANTHRREAKAEAGIIYYLIKNPDALGKLDGRLSEENFVTSFGKKMFSALSGRISAGEDVSISSFGSEFSPEEMGKLTGIIEEYSKLGITEEVFSEYVRALCQTRPQSPGDAGSLSKEEFAREIERRRRERK